MTDRAFPLNLSLDYQHRTGLLTDYFTALQVGQARASRCLKCGDVRIPPRFICPTDGEATKAVELPGTGSVAAITHTNSTLPFAERAAAHVFILAAMDGADNLMFGRVKHAKDITAVGERVCLAGTQGIFTHPAEASIFKIIDDI
jgi:uncharacterized OB-fold protein